MTVRVIRKSELANTSRHIKNDVYETYRFLLKPDAAEVTVTDIVLKPGIEATYGYESHIEIAYCIEGKALLTDKASGVAHVIEPGTMWVASKGTDFIFRAEVPTRLICVFHPAFLGEETGFAKDK
jgi:L-ectoine synthase